MHIDHFGYITHIESSVLKYQKRPGIFILGMFFQPTGKGYVIMMKYCTTEEEC